jgi:hypothetical protein
MRCRSIVLIVSAVAVLARVQRAAAEVVDQSQLIANAAIADFSETDLAQSFTPSYDNVSGAAIQLLNGGTGTADITISLYDHLPGPGATELAAGTEDAVSPGTLAKVEFASPAGVVAGQTYYLVFTSTNSGFGVGGDVNNPYLGGEAYAHAGYMGYPLFDYAFETFSIPGDVSAAPLPSAACGGLGLLGGLGALALARRRKAAGAN